MRSSVAFRCSSAAILLPRRMVITHANGREKNQRPPTMRVSHRSSSQPPQELCQTDAPMRNTTTPINSQMGIKIKRNRNVFAVRCAIPQPFYHGMRVDSLISIIEEWGSVILIPQEVCRPG
jgi:hypothetical protein